MHQLREIDDSFFETAPLVMPASVDLPRHSREEVWKALGSDRMWSWGRPLITGLRWTTPEPKQAGSVRVLKLAGVEVVEDFYRWDENERATFRVTEIARPIARGIAEDFLLEPLGPSGTRLTWTMAVEPAGPRPPALLARALLPGNKLAISQIKRILPQR